MADGPRFSVRLDEVALAEDLAHASARGRELGERECARLERDGVAVGELRACEAEGRDATRLAGCVKAYLPAPAGPWGVVVTGDREPAGPPVLVLLVFGVPSAQSLAPERLPGRPPPPARRESGRRSLSPHQPLTA